MFAPASPASIATFQNPLLATAITKTFQFSYTHGRVEYPDQKIDQGRWYESGRGWGGSYILFFLHFEPFNGYIKLSCDIGGS